MTAEAKDQRPQRWDLLAGWHLKRAYHFYDLSRRYALIADQQRAEYRKHVARQAMEAQRRVSFWRRPQRRWHNHDQVRADVLVESDPIYKDAVAAQQMYDRWCAREASFAKLAIDMHNGLGVYRIDINDPTKGERPGLEFVPGWYGLGSDLAKHREVTSD